MKHPSTLSMQHEFQFSRETIIYQLLEKKVWAFGMSEELIRLKEIGKGSSAIAYLAENKKGLFCVKVYKQSAAKQCEKEVKIMSDLDCKYLVKMLGLFADERGRSMLIELCPFGNLRKLVRRASEQKKSIPIPV
jgi:predicted Ser/Thr protein kinase